jgi:hypothetical protein
MWPERGRETRPTSPRTRTRPNWSSIARFTAPDISETVNSGALAPSVGSSSKSIRSALAARRPLSQSLDRRETAVETAERGTGMDVLLLGGGGREHALAWKIAQSPLVGRLWCAPGSDAIGEIAECVALDPCDPAAVALFARARGVGLAVIGPEAPLAAGVADALEAAGTPVFGPSAAAARLEVSKSFAREVADAVGAPGPRWARFPMSRRRECICPMSARRSWSRPTGWRRARA